MSDAIEWELREVRMKSVLYESQLLHEVVKLQRMRIVQLEEQVEMERTWRAAQVTRMAQMTKADDQVCQYCALPVKHGQVFCSRDCMFSYQRIHKPWIGAKTPEGRCIPGS